MTTWTRNAGGVAADTTTTNPVELYHAEVAALFEVVADDVVDGWLLDEDGVWRAPPPPAEPPAPPAPSSYYLPKVTFERRFPDAAFAALDGVRITVRNRPADWATLADAPWPSLRPFVRGLSDYDAAGEVNVRDLAMLTLLTALQATQHIFGADDEAAGAQIARILTPGPLDGEPATA